MASKLAEHGRFEEFAIVLESVVASGDNASKFASLLSLDLVSNGVARSLREGRIECVVQVLKKLDRLGVAPLKLFDGSVTELLQKGCQRMVDCGEVEKFVDLMETLAGNCYEISEIYVQLLHL